MILLTITPTLRTRKRRNNAFPKDATSSNAVDSIKDMTTSRNITMKVITLITIKTNLVIVPVEMTVMTHEATTSNKTPRTEMETETVTTLKQPAGSTQSVWTEQSQQTTKIQYPFPRMQPIKQ